MNLHEISIGKSKNKMNSPTQDDYFFEPEKNIVFIRVNLIIIHLLSHGGKKGDETDVSSDLD